MNRSGTIGRKEGHQLCNFFWPAGPADGNAADEVDSSLTRSILVDSVALRQLDDHSVRARGLNEARRDKIDPHSLRTDFVRKTFAQSNDVGSGTVSGAGRHPEVGRSPATAERGTHSPAKILSLFLLALAFLTNPDDMALAAHPTYRQRLAEGIAAAIQGYRASL